MGLGLGLKLLVDVGKLVALLVSEEENLLRDGRSKDLARGVGRELVDILQGET